MKKISILVCAIAFLSHGALHTVPIHDEVELVETIKKLHNDFTLYNDVLEYMNSHCESFQHRKKIKSVIKNQIAQFRNDLDNNVVSGMCQCFGLAFLGAVLCGNSPEHEESVGAKFCGISCMVGACILFWRTIVETGNKIYKLEILRKSF